MRSVIFRRTPINSASSIGDNDNPECGTFWSISSPRRAAYTYLYFSHSQPWTGNHLDNMWSRSLITVLSLVGSVVGAKTPALSIKNGKLAVSSPDGLHDATYQ